MLQLSGLSFTYPATSAPVLTDCSAQLPPGVSLVRGGDGQGKTTLLKLLAGELKADSGRVQLDSISLQDESVQYQGHVFWQDPRSEAHDALSAADYLRHAQARYPSFDATRLPHLLAGLSLEPHLHKQLFMLSTGSKRKVFLAAAFASGARLTLLDMPFAALDKPSISFLTATLAAEAEQAERVWVLADYEAPDGLPLAAELDLG